MSIAAVAPVRATPMQCYTCNSNRYIASSIGVALSNNGVSTTTFHDLPEETTAEIFSRLSIKDLIKSSSVNKAWYSLINNPSFISSQIRKAVNFCDDNAVLIIPPFISHQNYCSLISADTSRVIEKFDIPFVTKSGSLKLIAQVDGMLLLTDLHIDYASRELYLWNSFVRRHRVLVSSCFKRLLDDRDKSYYVVGMGYDKGTDDYKVIRIVYVQDGKGKQFGEVAPKVEVYSLRKNTWKKMGDSRVPRLVNEMGAYIDGRYYWVEMKQPGTEEFNKLKGNELKIMSYDFETQLFGEFNVPNRVPRLFGVIAPFKLMGFEGSLALCSLDPDCYNLVPPKYPFPIWLRRQRKGVGSWVLLATAVLKQYGHPLNITKTGTLIVESFQSQRPDETHIVSINFKSRISKDHGYGKHGGPDVSREVLAPSTVDTSFPQSLIMYEGGKSLLKYAK
ncbi:F-box protein At4g22390-like [Daucus carota subsp. sativus]|uniref:F-box protein At4g22390-like n=1 Tax=Daucus carota subsp. sativus TaxID=79200 RepID=UPI0030839070